MTKGTHVLLKNFDKITEELTGSKDFMVRGSVTSGYMGEAGVFADAVRTKIIQCYHSH